MKTVTFVDVNGFIVDIRCLEEQVFMFRHLLAAAAMVLAAGTSVHAQEQSFKIGLSN